MVNHVMTQAERMGLDGVAPDLHIEFRGIFGEETIEELLGCGDGPVLSRRCVVIGASAEPQAAAGRCRLTI